MTKTDLIKAVSEAKGITIKEATADVDLIIGLIEAELTEGNDVALHGFGTLKTVERAERECLNPQTKQKMIVPAKKTVTFKVAKGLKDKVNN